MPIELVATLHHAFVRYEAARAAVAAASTDHGSDALARELRESRIALCRALELSGWEPPDEVRLQLLHDRNQLARCGSLQAA